MNRRTVGVALLVVSVAAVFVLRFDTSAMPELGRYRDDAYYYFCIARNLLAGHGPSVSAEVSTSGFHVGWAALLVPLAAIGGSAGLVEGARFVGLALLVATGGMLFLGLRREGVARAWAMIGAFAVLADPRLVDEAQNGQETALGCFAIALLLAGRRARSSVFAAVCVFSIAARSDLALVMMALAAIRDESRARRAIGPALALACYASWNILLAGHPLQDSAAPMPWLAHENFASAGWSNQLRALWWWARPCLLGAPFATMGAAGVAALVALAFPLSGRARIAPMMLVALAAALGAGDLMVPAIAAVLFVMAPSMSTSVRRPAIALLAAAVSLVVLHWAIRWYPRDYYVAPLGVAGAWAIARYGAAATRPGQWLLMLALAGTLAVRLLAPLPDRSWQESMVLAGCFADRFVPADATIGSFNSGILSWHRPGPVLNLDGVVDRPAFEALRAHALGSFLDRRGVEWLCDNPVQFTVNHGVAHACGRFFGADFDPARELVEVARFVGMGTDAGRPGTGTFRLYRRGAWQVDAVTQFDDLSSRPGGGRWIAWRGAPGEELICRRSGEDLVIARAVPGVTLVLATPSPHDGAISIHSRSDASGLSRPLMTRPR